MDIKKLQQAVFEKTGIRLDDADPVFAIVALNEAVIGQLLQAAAEGREQANQELETKLGNLVKIHDQIVMAARELAGRVDQAHLAAALKAATEAKSEIMQAARSAVSAEVEKAATIVADNAAQLAAATTKRRHSSWTIAIVQSLIGGMVAAVIVLAALHR